ncbi:GNAT family N-acetyltransferase [Streptomyces lavendulae]|uniref:GNAT family N-acetyltransferase n=1 Tax=Streptomyces lavendulae TaxID=1914 RepID=UPI00382B5BD7
MNDANRTATGPDADNGPSPGTGRETPRPRPSTLPVGVTVIDTARLLLRPLRAEDLDDLADYRARPEVFRYQGHEPWDREQLARVLDGEVRHARLPYTVTGRILWGVLLKETGRLIGEVMLAGADGAHEIGVVFHPDHQRRGLAFEAVNAVLTRACAELGVARVQAYSHPDNTRAIRLLGRLGLHRSGTADGFDTFERTTLPAQV